MASSAGPASGPEARSVGVDVGGTQTKVVRWDGHTVTQRVVVETSSDLASHFGAFVGDAVRSVIPDPRGVGAVVGVAVPGLVDPRTGMALWSANLGWRDLRIAGLVGTELGVPVVGGHDVRAGLLGEQRAGAARGVDDVLFVPLGTGLASALMLGGRVLAGSEWAGEIGHVVIDPDGPACGCGRRGCLEAYAAGLGIARRWTEASGREGDAETVTRLVSEGDPVAVRIWGEAVDALAGALGFVVAATGVQRVVIGGGLARAGDVLLQPLRSELQRRLPNGFPLEIVRAALGGWSGAVGAAVLAAEAFPS